MVRSELVLRIADQNPHLYAEQVEAVVDTILDRITAALADGDRVELRDFGAFSVRCREPRAGRNPRTGVSVSVPARTSVHFKPGKDIRERLKLKLADQKREAECPGRAS
ncbi:integration host factor subunit beta [Methylobacterium sp. J-001]|uniref:integration host factor subunit beta n=1 Tax=Methylobacterium sp. J-001 TaxID=2836609 RepID=UPI001FB919F6|nr:integration host factor subunit beta [Methylobacterium sp. J-001]MCJ2115735.1 integration host factor subunit beta [Methylobacterium sp. J-001]